MWVSILFRINSALQKYEHRTSYIIIIPSPKQWTGRGVYIIYKAYYEKCIKTNEDIHVALLQIRVTPLKPGLPSPATLLFNHPI